jgi:hypothetical protein
MTITAWHAENKGGRLVCSRNLGASVLIVCASMAGVLGVAPIAASGASAGQSALKLERSTKHYVLKNKRRFLITKIRLPVGPSYIYYDYPYYYARGYYPTHIGGYIYYPSHAYYRRHYRRPIAVRSQRLREK